MLTYEQEARLPEWMADWAAKRAAIARSTEPADWATFTDAARRCYEYAGIPWHGRVVRVSSPLAFSVAAPIASAIASRTGPYANPRERITKAAHDEVRDALVRSVHYQLLADAREAERRALEPRQAWAGADWKVCEKVDLARRYDDEHSQLPALDEVVDAAVSTATGKRTFRVWHRLAEDPVFAREILDHRYYGQLDGHWGVIEPSGAWLFRDICGLDLGDDLWDRARAYADAQSAAGPWWAHRDFVMVCDRPEAFRTEHGWTSLRWRDGWGFAYDNLDVPAEFRFGDDDNDEPPG